MQLIIPQLGLIFVPILKNASRTLSEALTKRWPDAQTVGPDFPARRVVMWRDPYDRVESLYRMRIEQGVTEDFNEWILDVCRDNVPQDPHMQPQNSYCINPFQLFRWDFDGFAKLFKLKERHLTRVGETEPFRVDWRQRALDAFNHRYAADIRIWGGPVRSTKETGSECLGGSQIDSPG
jgi:hypothetical protein